MHTHLLNCYLERGIVMYKFTDLTGRKFGRLTVLKRVENKGGHLCWECLCDCGNIKIVRGFHLCDGHTLSCGCLQKERTAETHTTHGMNQSRLHKIWIGMKNRCFNPKNYGFKNYGGRGIKVCDEWKDDFQAFYDHVSQLPHFGEEGYSLDRINNNGNYEPGNVRWATRTEQNKNKRHPKKYKKVGE